MPRLRFLTCSLLACLVSRGSKLAAQRPLEFGVDAAAGVNLGGGSTSLVVNIPAGVFRIGVPVSGRLALEPQFVLDRTEVSDFGNVTFIRLSSGAVFALGGQDRWKKGLFLRPNIGFDYASVGVENGTRPVVGFGVGIKLPIAKTISSRSEISYQYGFQNDGFSESNALIFSTGLSFFNK